MKKYIAFFVFVTAYSAFNCLALADEQTTQPIQVTSISYEMSQAQQDYTPQNQVKTYDDNFVFDHYDMPNFSETLASTGMDIYDVLKKQTDFHLDQGDSEYGKYDTIPLVEDQRFDFNVKLYTERYGSIFQKWLNRSNQYIYIVRDIFRREGVPEDLVYLPFTESGFNPSITSRAGACGMWQFIRSTGQLYGLQSNFWMDERRDFEKATTAAARHLRDLYDRLGDWYLALAAYNAGQGKIQNAIRMYGTTDFYELVKSGNYLRPETKDYVPKFLALRYLARNYSDFGFTTPNGLPLLYEKVDLYRQADLYVIADLIGTDIDTLRELNPELMTPMTPPVDVYTLRVPYGKKTELENKLEHITDEELAQFFTIPAKAGTDLDKVAEEYGIDTAQLVRANGFSSTVVPKDTYVFVPIPDAYDDELNADFASELNRYNPKVYVVKKGDTFDSIADKYGMTTDELAGLNQYSNIGNLKVGQSLVISDDYFSEKSQRIAITKPLKTQDRDTSDANTTATTYTVKPGETLWRIATRYGVTVADIKSANGIKGTAIASGMELKINAPAAKVRRYTDKSVDSPTKYRVRTGDNLWAIAKKFGTSVDDIKKRNGVGRGIHPGMVLYID